MSQKLTGVDHSTAPERGVRYQFILIQNILTTEDENTIKSIRISDGLQNTVHLSRRGHI